MHDISGACVLEVFSKLGLRNELERVVIYVYASKEANLCLL